MKRTAGGVLIVLVLAAAVCVWWPGVSSERVTIDVAHGATAHEIADRMVEAGLVHSKIPVMLWVKARGAGSRIKVGRYMFRHDRSAFWIVNDLVNGATVKIRVVIPEGFASWQIAERLEASGICAAAPFLEVVKRERLEGFLFPATYEFDYGLPAHSVADFMRRKFDRIWVPAFQERAEQRGWTRKEAVTMASIVEREVRDRSEIAIVSALYNNRLKKGMPLEADPTVQYALGHWKSRLLYRDYRETKSPYNTYLHKGLPPGPICNPGVEAIRAALWPADADVFYMVATEDGRHDFSRTYREHVNKVNERNRRWRRRGRGAG